MKKNTFHVIVPQANRRRAFDALKTLKNTEVESGGYTDGSTTWLFYVDTTLSQEEVEEHLTEYLGHFEILTAED